jgi:hypothetical protein
MAKSATTWRALFGSALICASSAAYAQDAGALIDVLVKKGILTDQEAVDVKTDLLRDAGATPAGKLNLSAGTTEFRIGGDLRVRYEYREGENDLNDRQERNRFRYRFRLGFTGKVYNDFFYGFRLETSTGSRSSNVTMGDDGGPWAKNNDLVNVGQAYIGWSPNSSWSVMAGRMPNPLVTTSMVWDGDINPEGFAEQYKLHTAKVDYFVNLGQFLYATAGSQNVFGSTPTNTDALLLAWQGGAKFTLTGGSSIQVAPVLYTYVNQKQTTNPTPFRGAFTAGNMTGINNIFVFEVPVEYAFNIGDVASRVFGDFAYNIEGDDRARKWGRADLDGENKAYHFGFQYGKAVNKGEWDAKIFYQSVGAFALDPNLVDSDLFDSRTNMKGFAFTGNYALGSATQISFTIGQGKRKNRSIVAPGSGDIATGNLNEYWVGQLDLNLKF